MAISIFFFVLFKNRKSSLSTADFPTRCNLSCRNCCNAEDPLENGYYADQQPLKTGVNPARNQIIIAIYDEEKTFLVSYTNFLTIKKSVEDVLGTR